MTDKTPKSLTVADCKRLAELEARNFDTLTSVERDEMTRIEGAIDVELTRQNSELPHGPTAFQRELAAAVALDATVRDILRKALLPPAA